jgi:hypothetical protein
LISVQSGMLLVLGFLLASLLGLLLASAFWSRAVRLTTARLKQSMPVSEPEIRADRDKLKAEHAVKVHKLAAQLEHSKLERARHLIEINRRDASISALETNAVAAKAELEEHQNARRVLEQTVADRLPRVEARLAEAKRVLFQRDREIAELTQSAQPSKSGGASPATGQNLELDALKEKIRDQAGTIDTLRRQIELSASARDGRAGTSASEEADDTLASRIEDQTTEIARLKAALEAFEKPAKSGRLLGGANKQALVSRADAAEAQVERQAATIEKLRADLATTHQRLARQAAHFKESTHRPGVADAPELHVESREPSEQRRNLVDRVAYVRPSLRGEPDVLVTQPETPATNGNGSHGSDGAKQDQAEAAVAEMPQNPTIERKPRMRLLDRLIDVRKD